MTLQASEPEKFFEVLEMPPDPASEPPPFVDLEPFLSGTATQEVPNVARMETDCALFYSGRLNEIHGEPGAGKTNVIIAALKAELEAGGKVLYIDPEDTPAGFTTRARLFGIDPEVIRFGVSYLHNPEPEHIQAAQSWAFEARPTLIILDGLAEAMAGIGVNEDKAQEILPFFKSWLRPFAEAGAAVVIADHVTKSTEGRGRFARGSGAKLGRYDGVSYGIELGKAYSPGNEGFVRLRVAKDRNGGVGSVGYIAGELHFIPDLNTDGTRVEWRKPERTNGEWKPTAIMEKIVKHLQIYSQDTKRGICSAVSSKRETVLKAIECLVSEGRITVEQSGKSHILKLAEEEAK